MASASDTTVVKLADFVNGTRYENLPSEVVTESKRLLLDSIACALGGAMSDKGKWGLEFARRSYPAPLQSTVIGFGDRLSETGAAFANGELINAMDYDAILPPGHVSPYVIPSILAVAQTTGASGKDVLAANALAHEVSHRIGSGLPYVRDIVGGKVVWPAVSGYSCCVFGGAGAIAKLRGLDSGATAHSMGMAGQIAPVQSMSSWVNSRRPTTAKYLVAGVISQAELTAVGLVEAGHRGELSIMDGDHGFWRFAGAPSWDAAPVVRNLGSEWRFPALTSYKAYPCCRALAGSLDCLAAIMETENLRTDEIDGIKAYAESNIAMPIFQEREPLNQSGVQSSLAYNLALVAHRIEPGPQWLNPAYLTDRGIRRVMEKISYEPHPGFAEATIHDARARLARVEVRARGRVFAKETTFPKGSPSSEPSSFMTDDELWKKFTNCASYLLPTNRVEEAADHIMHLEKHDGIHKLMSMVSV